MLSIFLLLPLIQAVQADYFGSPVCSGPNKEVSVHLFEWKWSDIAAECPWLAEHGFCAVQVSPPQEHAVLDQPGDYYPAFPWWQRYQPVSYNLESRSGTEEEFASMVQMCNDVGVYIYVDAVIQHMARVPAGYGSGGSYYNPHTLNYEGVPYSELDFHSVNEFECPNQSGQIEDYNNAQDVRFCRLENLPDLRTSSNYVRDMVAEYMNKLIGYGVAGFRVDACKHTTPEDLAAIYGQLDNLDTKWFPSETRPYIFQEVIFLGGSEPITPADYIGFGRVTEFKYSASIGEVFRGRNGQMLRYLENFGEGWSFMDGLDAVVFIDNHDNQRGHGAGGDSILTYKNDRLYKMATAFELAYHYGAPRLMSSFAFTNTEAGPPSNGGVTDDVQCFEEWICEHRWRQIYNMVGFHNVAMGTAMSHWKTISDNAIAFGREGRGFIIINNENFDVQGTFDTGMPDGEYCDVIMCNNPSPPCSGEAACRSITVVNGLAFITVAAGEDPIVAIHV